MSRHRPMFPTDGKAIRAGVVRAWVGSALLAAIGVGVSSGATIAVGPGSTIGDALAKARPGDVVALPSGTIPGGIRLPDGVSLRGAGYRETTIDARTSDSGVTISGGEGAEVADLSIRGGTTGLLIKAARGVTVRRVRVTEAMDGIRLIDVTRGRVENAVIDGNRYGVPVTGGRENIVVNCTLAGNSGIGVSLGSGEGHTVFNNCMTEGTVGVYVGEAAGSVHVDHNLYFTLFVGKLGDQVARRTSEDWKYLSGLDAHSVKLPVTYRDPKAGDYRPVGMLGWSQERAATSDWGAAKFAGVEAPDRDSDGRARSGRFDVGAFEAAPTPTRPAEGTLKVVSDEGIKSAGIFDARGRLVAYLFHNLPLPAGSYPYWFPPRDSLGGRIAPGTYEVRQVESDNRWEYLGHVGDNGEDYPMSHTAPVNPSGLAFDDAGHLLVGQGWSEDWTNVRAYELATGKVAWTFDGTAGLNGLSMGSDGALYLVQPADDKKLDLVRVETAHGKIVPFGPKGTTRVRLDLPMDVVGLAELDGRVYVTDTKANKVRFRRAGSPEWEGSVDVASPSSPASDRKTKVVWVISEGRRVLALTQDGRMISERDFSGLAPAALAANNGRLAVATKAEGLVRILDIPDPRSKATSGRTIGRGDGPYGPYLPDRFTFQQAAGTRGLGVWLGLGPKGELAVIDDNRVLVFDEKGHPTWDLYGLFGNNTLPSYSDPRRVYDTDGRRSLLLTTGPDGTASWKPEAYYDLPVQGHFFGDFPEAGKVYGLFGAVTQGKTYFDLVVVRYEGHRALPVSAIIYDPRKKLYFTRRDANRDGHLDANDGGEVLKGRDGKPMTDVLFHGQVSMRPDGDLLQCFTEGDQWLTLWHRSRDLDGTPIYRGEDREKVAKPRAEFISPYTWKADPHPECLAAVMESGGGFVANLRLASSPDGVGVFHNAGTDLAGIDRDGRARWLHAYDHDKGLMGLADAGPCVITGVGTTAEIIAVDRDGLGLGGFSMPARVHYTGFFLDHPQAVRAYRGADGRDYALIADNAAGRHHWFRLDRADQIRHTSTPVVLGPQAADVLAALPTPPPYTSTKPKPPLVRIPGLAQAMPIDGDLEKWRRSGIRPQVIVTTEAAYNVGGPKDCSAVVRLAHHGADLYAQFLVFDDKVSFHQGLARRYKQDGVEMALNGFSTGFKFDVSDTTDAGPVVVRNRFYAGKLEWSIPASHAPLTIKVLDNARDVRERELIEGVYGVDMGDCRVIVIEFKLPIDEVTYKDSLKELKEITPWGPGREFWLGFYINDNDDPGTDIQNFLSWPATYGTFSPKEDGARAVLE